MIINLKIIERGVFSIEEFRICTKCDQEKPIEVFPNCKRSLNGKKRYCIDCGKLMKKKFKIENPVEFKIRQCAENLVNRLGKFSNTTQNLSYQRKGIKSLIGNTSAEVYKYLYDNHYDDYKRLLDNGDVPSIDRIDSNKHYEPGNIRIIPFSENSRMGRESSKKVCSKPIRITYKQSGESVCYESIVDAGEKSEFSRFILSNILKNKVKKDHGIIVEYISEDEKMKVIKVSQNGCAPCLKVENYLKGNDVEYEDVNINTDPNAIEKYNIMSTPVTILQDEEGVEIQRIIGYDVESLDDLVAKFQ